MCQTKHGERKDATLKRDQASVSELGTRCEEPIRLEHHGTYV